MADSCRDNTMSTTPIEPDKHYLHAPQPGSASDLGSKPCSQQCPCGKDLKHKHKQILQMQRMSHHDQTEIQRLSPLLLSPDIHSFAKAADCTSDAML